jgi:hypothetical protein
MNLLPIDYTRLQDLPVSVAVKEQKPAESNLTALLAIDIGPLVERTLSLIVRVQPQ